MKGRVRFLLVAGLLLVLGITVFLALAATWEGFWGGQSLWPETEDYEKGSWEEPPVCYALTDDLLPWPPGAKEVARTAIEEWNQAPIPLMGRILEVTDPRCAGRSIDILILWADSRSISDLGDLDVDDDGLHVDASGLVGFYVPIRVAPPIVEELEEEWKVEGDPCVEVQHMPRVGRCSVILLNADNPNGWFIDTTPGSDDEFVQKEESRCGVPTTVWEAKPGEDAHNKHDLYTVIEHEFGHALGLIHSGGCNLDPRDDYKFRPREADDDGSLMWGGSLKGTRRPDPPADLAVGFSERRHLSERDLSALRELYPWSLEVLDPTGDLFAGETGKPAEAPFYLDVLAAGIAVEADAVTFMLEVREAIPPLEEAKGTRMGYLFVIDTDGEAVEWGIPFRPKSSYGWDYWAVISYWPSEPDSFLRDLREWRMVNPELDYTIAGRFLTITVPLRDLGNPEMISWFAIARTDVPYYIVDRTETVTMIIRVGSGI